MALAENISILKPKSDVLPVHRQAVRTARLRKRHIVALLSFVILVCLPLLVSSWYLWMRAADQFASTLAFSVRSEEASSGIELLGGIADFSGSGANDSDVLYDYLHSQHLVANVQASLNIADQWAKPKRDPIFAFKDTGMVEDLHKHWDRMIDISLDSTRGIIEIHTRAFDPDTAQMINAEILAQSNNLINEINNIAHEDAVRYALDDLGRTKQRLGQARAALTEFRILNELVDPAVDASTQTSLLGTLDAQLTETLIEIEMLSVNTRRSDTRLAQAKQRRNILQTRIEQERTQRVVGKNNNGKRGMAQVFGDYERLVVEVEFAEQSYQAARATFESAVSDARRNTRYLAAHIEPTHADQSLFPQRGLILSFIAMIAVLTWALLSLIGFSFLDRR